MKTIQMKGVPSLFLTSMIMVAVGLLLFIGLLNRENDLIVLSVLVFGIVIAMKAWSKSSKSGIEHSFGISRNRVFPGETVNFIVSVENHKPIPVWLEVEAPLGGSQNAFSEPGPLTKHQSLLWYQRTVFRWELKAIHRGISTIGPLRIISGDLLGFFLQESGDDENQEFIVYPRIVPLAPFKFPRRDFFGIPGGQSPVDDPVYILGTSDYHHGRPAKYIHWKASARYQRLQEKVFDSSEQEKVLFLIDVSSFLKEHAVEEFELGIEVIASLAVQCERRGCAIGLLTNGVVMGAPHSIAISRSSRQLSVILETLARLQLENREDLLNTLQGTGIFPWGTSCLYLTFDDNEGTSSLREYLRRRKIPLVILTRETIISLRNINPEGPQDFVPPPHQIPQEEVRTA
jgi:uncharacterized protein (DUF58 family)